MNVKTLPALSQKIKDEQTAINGQSNSCRIPDVDVTQQMNLCLQNKE